MHQQAFDPHRQQGLYWNELNDLQVMTCYIRRYRDYYGRWVKGLAGLKAVASCGGIAAWALWKEYAFWWGMIIAASQLADALKEVFPFAKLHKRTSEYTIILRHLFVDAQLEWEMISSGQYTDEQIMRLCHQLRKRRLEAEQECVPDGLPLRGPLRDQAVRDANDESATLYRLE